MSKPSGAKRVKEASFKVSLTNVSFDVPAEFGNGIISVAYGKSKIVKGRFIQPFTICLDRNTNRTTRGGTQIVRDFTKS